MHGIGNTIREGGSKQGITEVRFSAGLCYGVLTGSRCNLNILYIVTHYIPSRLPRHSQHYTAAHISHSKLTAVMYPRVCLRVYVYICVCVWSRAQVPEVEYLKDTIAIRPER